MTPLNLFFLKLKVFFKQRPTLCPFCLAPFPFKKEVSSCNSCEVRIPASFLRLPFHLISFQGKTQKHSFETFLIRAFEQGDLKEKHLDLSHVSPSHPELYVLSFCRRERVRPLCYIRFVHNIPEKLFPSTSVFFYTLEASQPSSSDFEVFLHKTIEIFSKKNRFFQRKPLFILNVIPFEEVLLNMPSFLFSTLKKDLLSSPCVFSSYVRSIAGLWFGRRLLSFLEETFPKKIYTSFNDSQEGLCTLMAAPFFWILQTWGYLSPPQKPSFLRPFLWQKIKNIKIKKTVSQGSLNPPPTFKDPSFISKGPDHAQ